MEIPAREGARRSKRLWIAVLNQAIEDAKGRGTCLETSRTNGVQRDALIWLFHDRSGAVNSFPAICALLEINPYWARQRLRQVPAIRWGLDRTRREAVAEKH